MSATSFVAGGIKRKPVSTSRIRVSGILSHGSRGLILQTDDGLWIIEAGETADCFLGEKVTVEGDIVGFDRLRADWVGSARDRSGRLDLRTGGQPS